jgi:predicted small metal-binding protein
MYKRIVSALLVLGLFVAFSGVTFAQQEMKKEAPKTEMKKDEMVKKEEAMGPAQSLDCGKECGFVIKSRDEKELMSMARMHLKTHHNMAPSDKELKAMLKTDAPAETKHQ